MKRSAQEIVELAVFGLIATLVGIGVLWVTGWVLGLVGAVMTWLAALVWSLVRFLVPVALVAGLAYLLVRLLTRSNARVARDEPFVPSPAPPEPAPSPTPPSADTAAETAAVVDSSADRADTISSASHAREEDDTRVADANEDLTNEETSSQPSPSSTTAASSPTESAPTESTPTDSAPSDDERREGH